MTTYSLIKDLYLVLSGDQRDFYSKYEVLVGILSVVADYEASEHTHKDPKLVNMSLYINGDDRYYTFDNSFANSDFIEGQIKINGIIPGGTFKAFVINEEMAAILIGNNYSGQSIALRKEGTRWISK